MPDIPTPHFDPKQTQREREERARSPLYWVHPSVTVYEYRNMSRAEQDRVQQECRQIERAKRNS